MSEHLITEELVECAKVWEEMGFEFERTATCNAIKEITRLREALDAVENRLGDGLMENNLLQAIRDGMAIASEALQETDDD